ncbi:MAG: hypothetical protein H5U40_15410, partial [Polyangiaceae bacterium]|nr:hypothetical protein [Polyangiaceae bacterium]
AERFAERSVESLTSAELGPYFRYLSEVLSRALWRSVERRAPMLVRLAQSPNVRLTSTMTALERRTGQAFEVRADVRQWLVKWAQDYGREASREWRHLEEAKADHPWFAAGRELGAWLESERRSLTDAEREKVLGAVLSPFSGNGGPQRYRYHHDVFPGLDVLGLGLQIWDGARRDAAGFPERLPARMCPTRIDSRGVRSSGACSSNFFSYVVEDDALFPRFTAELLRRNDPQLVETAFGALDEAQSDRVLAMWRGLEPSFPVWSAATRAIVSGRGRTQRERSREIYDDLVRQWRERPDRHAELLFALTTLELHDSPSRGARLVHFTDWTRIFGARISPAVYQAFLASDPTAARMAWTVFPALPAGPSRVAGVLPLLPEPIGSGSAERMFAGYTLSVWDCLGKTIDVLEELGDQAALAHIRRYLEDRAREHPSHDRALRA